MSEYIEFAVRVPKSEADRFIARFGKSNVKILGFFLGEEIIRCRDCKYYDTAGPWCFEPSKVFIDEYGMDICPTVHPDGFCSWGERRDA